MIMHVQADTMMQNTGPGKVHPLFLLFGVCILRAYLSVSGADCLGGEHFALDLVNKRWLARMFSLELVDRFSLF